jgi:CheY-like chemotaxis protein
MADAAPSARGLPGRVLLVEDNDLVRRLATAALEREGHLVVAAADGEEALRFLSETPLPFDLLVTDLVMPVMNGYELAARILELSGPLPVLFTSGYADAATLPPVPAASAVAFLAKPYRIPQLTGCVAGLLS